MNQLFKAHLWLEAEGADRANVKWIEACNCELHSSWHPALEEDIFFASVLVLKHICPFPLCT